MSTSLEKSNVSLASERGFSFRAVNHDGFSIFCNDGVLQEIFPGVYLTVDPVSGIGLIEVNPAQRAAKLFVNGQDVLDIVQVSRRDVLSVDGNDYVFLKYMDTYVNRDRVRTQGSVVIHSNPKVVPFAAADRQPAALTAVRSSPSSFQLPHRTKMLAVAAAVVTVMSISAIVFFGPGSMSPLEEKASDSKVVQSLPTNPVKKTPTTINDLIEEEERSAGTAESTKKNIAVEPNKKSVKSGPHVAAKQAPAIWIKPAGPNKVKKPTATPTAPAASEVSDVSMKSFEGEYQEAVLIKGYDQDRSARLLKKLQKKVPAGTALHQKIENELR